MFLLLSAEPAKAPPSAEVLARSILATYQQVGPGGARGASYSVTTGENLWGSNLYAVGIYPDREESCPSAQLSVERIRQYIERNIDVLYEPNHCIGLWLNDQGSVIFDISRTTPSGQEAAQLALRHRQIKFFGLRQGFAFVTDSFWLIAFGYPENRTHSQSFAPPMSRWTGTLEGGRDGVPRELPVVRSELTRAATEVRRLPCYRLLIGP